MHIFLRKQGTDEVQRVGFYEFQDRIRNGEVSPDDEIKDNVLTKNDWWPVRELRLFHRLSPTTCEPGVRLQRRYQVEQVEREAAEAAAAKWSKLAAEARPFFRIAEDVQIFGLARSYQFLRMHDERPLWHYKQALRFMYFPSFDLPLFARISSMGDEWELVAARGFSQPAVRRIGIEVVRRALDLAGRAKLSLMPAEERVLGCDGATWILEFAENGDYVIRERWSPRMRPELVPELIRFVALAEFMASLSELLRVDERMY